MPYSGNCACGAVHLEVSGEPIATRQCWCRQCQQAASGGPTHNAMFNTAAVDLSGETPAGIPELSMSLGGTYTHEFAGGTKAIAHVDYAYESPVQIVEGLSGFPAGVAEGLQREVNSLNASFTIRLTNGLDVGVWGRNLTNEAWVTTIFPGVAQAGTLSGYRSQPRTFGGLLRYRF